MDKMQSRIPQSCLDCVARNAEAVLHPRILQALLASDYNEAMIVFGVLEAGGQKDARWNWMDGPRLLDGS